MKVSTRLSKWAALGAACLVLAAGCAGARAKKVAQPNAKPTPTAIHEETASARWSTWTVVDEPYWEGVNVSGDASVLKEGDTYFMYYTDRKAVGEGEWNFVISKAWSKDCVNWQPVDTGADPPGKVFEGVPGTWEAEVEACHVIKKDGEYWMYYSGYPEPGDPVTGFPGKLALATSKDGVHFERYPDNPILVNTPGWHDSDAIFSPDMIEKDGVYYMVYCGHCYWNCDVAPGVNVLGATSTDGIHWTKHDEPVLAQGVDGLYWTKGGVAEPSLLEGLDGRYYLFFTGLWTSEHEERTCGIAVGDSPFGPWEVNPEPIITKGPPGSFREWQVIAPDTMLEGTRVHMWTIGVGNNDFNIGYAYSDWPLCRKSESSTGFWAEWTKYPGNPVYDEGHFLVSDPTIMRDGDIYRMYYTDGELSDDPDPVMCVATSADGIHWAAAETGTTNPPGRVLDGIEGTWEDQLEAPLIVKSDRYYLYYGGYTEAHDGVEGYPAHMGLAISDDGLHFTRIQDEPILRCTKDWWDGSAAYSPDAVRDGDTYYMVYCAHCHAFCDFVEAPSIVVMGAYSTDLITWTKTSRPVLQEDPSLPWMNGFVAEPAIVKGPDGAFYLFFTAFDAQECTSIGIARGPTPFGPWDVNPEPILTRGPDGAWDSSWMGAPTVLIEGNIVRLWYTGWKDDYTKSAIGFATAPWPLK